MATIYVVTSGELQGCRVYGVFDTLEKAEYMQELFMADDIEEFELNHILNHPTGMLMFDVTMDFNGNCPEGYGGIEQISPEFESEGRRKVATTSGIDLISFHIWARDEEDALMFANAKRISLIASGKLTTDRKTWEDR